MMSKRHFLLLIACMIPGFLMGQSSPTTESKDDDNQVIEESVVVWATAVKTSTTKLSQDTLTIRQADHVSDLLRTLPGVDVGGAHSLNQRITIRSMDDKDLQITIDGASQNSYMYHHMGNLQIHADILKSVDIQVGTNSVVNGGLGGGAAFKTKDAQDLLASDQKIGARFLANLGSNDSHGFSVTGYGRLGDSMDFLVYFNGVTRDNYKVGGSGIKDENGDLVPGTDGRVRGHEGDLSDGLFKLGWNLSDGHRLSLSLEDYVDDGDYSYRPDMGLATDLAIADNLNLPLVYPTEFERDTFNLAYEGFVGGNTSIEANAFVNTSHLWRDEAGVAAVFGGESIIEGDAQNSGLRVVAHTVLGQGVEHQLNYGLSYVDYQTEYVTDAVLRSDESMETTALFIEDRIQINERFLVVPGVRYESADLDSSLTSDSFDRFNGALAFEFQASDALTFKASGIQLFKAPEIGEVFVGAGLYDSANPNIEAETGTNLELGFAYQDHVLGADQFSFGATLFQTDINDYIYDYVRTESFRGKDNVGDLTIDGFELYLGYDIKNLQLVLSYDVADSELDADQAYPHFDGARLDRQQGDSLSFNLDYTLPQYGLAFHWDTLSVKGVDAALDLDGASLDNAKDSYTIHNLALRWSPQRFKGAQLVIAADNVFDTYYASQSSRTGVSFHPRFGTLYLLDYEPGRNVKTSVSYRF